MLTKVVLEDPDYSVVINHYGIKIRDKVTSLLSYFSESLKKNYFIDYAVGD